MRVVGDALNSIEHEGDEDKELDPDDGVKVNIETLSCFCSGGVVIGVFQIAKGVTAPSNKRRKGLGISFNFFWLSVFQELRLGFAFGH